MSEKAMGTRLASNEKKAVVFSIGKPFENLTESACDGLRIQLQVTN